MKTCSQCKISKNEIDFYFRNEKPIAECKECQKAKYKIKYQNNKDYILNRQKDYNNSHKKERKNYLDENKDILKEKAKNSYKSLHGRFMAYKKTAKRSDLEFLLTEKEFSLFWKQNCFYCNDKIETIGLDRIDNNIGYNINNIVSCCIECNYLKSKHDTKKLKQLHIKLEKIIIRLEEIKK